MIDFSNPPTEDFYPSGPADKRHLRASQMHAVAWMISRIEAGGGIVADEIGLGKIPPLSYYF
jgi:SNF2 family DNA or RNA helicase